MRPDEPSSAPASFALAVERVRTLRHGENPDDVAALYARAGDAAALEVLKEGSGLSYGDVLDLEAAFPLAARFAAPACVIVKHAQPCGAAVAEALPDAWAAAFHADESSARGGVVAFNRALDGATAALVAARPVACVAAPGFESAALQAFAPRTGVRLVRLAFAPGRAGEPEAWEPRLVGRWAVLSHGPAGAAPEWRVVTERQPTVREMQGLRIAWEISSSALSDAVAIVRGTSLVALGAGQTSRADAVDVALLKARRAGHDLRDTVLASDGSFTSADDVERALEAGITGFVQPGGSVRDDEVIGACDRRGLAMLFTDRAALRH
jgi:phosphoribosylaminoimidazolecarboxamide formyltransferase/IMP cyclohydrolase